MGYRPLDSPGASFAHDLYQDALLPSSIELPIEYLFPRSKVQPPICHCNDYLTPHNLSLEMRVTVVLARKIMAVTSGRFVRSQFLQLLLVVLMQATLIVIDEDRCRDVHGVHER